VAVNMGRRFRAARVSKRFRHFYEHTLQSGLARNA
jgi:hypothetical protein